jgi:hypothetical protein
MEAIWHSIKVCLFPKILTKEDLNDFVARVNSEKSLNVRLYARNSQMLRWILWA